MHERQCLPEGDSKGAERQGWRIADPVRRLSAWQGGLLTPMGIDRC